MKNKRFSAEKKATILQEFEKGKTVEVLCREYGISQATFYNWRKQYGGMSGSDVKELQSLKEENAKLKRMFTDKCLELEIAKEIIEKKL